MKGGITSGIIYPAAVAEVAKTFVFKNIGGTSAGAIAAALTAAAEYRRAKEQTTQGFDRLADIPKWLQQDDRLYKLFAPNSATQSLYKTIVGLAGRPRFHPAIVAKWCGLVWAFPMASAIGSVFGMAMLWMVLGLHGPLWLRILMAVLAALVIGAGITIACLISLYLDVRNKLPKNSFGLVLGVDDKDRSNEIALSTWLTKEIEDIAGLPPGQAPLTFGMLWDPSATIGDAIDKPEHPIVNLEMIATNISYGRPYQFPLSTEQFFFHPDELRGFFPDHVVDWMVKHARGPRDEEEKKRFARYAPFRPLPEPANLPVIVATRMSLAFPVLLSAVPLYAADFGKPSNWEVEVPNLERCWFSDGGISSNFPVAIFDSPLPRWPTFAINLAGFPDGRSPDPDESKNVYMPRKNSAGRQPGATTIRTLPSFFGAIANAMQNWNDNRQAILPGYRDRIVTVFLSDSEGGLNLDMPADVLERLRLRGVAAGRLLAERFHNPSTLDPAGVGMNWENHRWLRLRSTMGALKTYLAALEKAYSNPQLPDVPFDDLIKAEAGTPVRHYPIPQGQRQAVATLAHQIAGIGATLEQMAAIDGDLPKPSPNLVLRPSMHG